MPLGGCPHCNYEKPVLTTQDHQRAAGLFDRGPQGPPPVTGNGYMLIADHGGGNVHTEVVPHLPGNWQGWLLKRTPYQGYPNMSMQPLRERPDFSEYGHDRWAWPVTSAWSW